MMCPKLSVFFGLRVFGACVMCCSVLACQNLEPFMYAPMPASADADLMAAATQIPPHLREELVDEIVAEDGTVVNAWYLSHDPNDGTPQAHHQTSIFYCHGNTRNISLFSLRVQALWAAGYNVLIFDYRGYGKTRGTPTEAGLYQDARAARLWLQNHGDTVSSSDRIALYGYSLGTAICTQMAFENAPQALILEAPFASVQNLVRDDMALDVPHAWVTQATYDTVGKIQDFTGSLLVLHGTDDTYLRAEYGNMIVQHAEKARSRKLVLVPGADHDTVPCTYPAESTAELGGCAGGFSPIYLQHVQNTIDAVIAPSAQ